MRHALFDDLRCRGKEAEKYQPYGLKAVRLLYRRAELRVIPGALSYVVTQSYKEIASSII